MAEKRKEASFTVTDRRLFTEDGELREDVREREEETAPWAGLYQSDSGAVLDGKSGLVD